MIYLYQLEYRNGSPFYVGVSKDIHLRLLSHINEARKQITEKDKLIWGLWVSGNCPTIRALAVFGDRYEATRVEHEYISRFPDLINVQGNSTRLKLERWYELYCPDCDRKWVNERVRVWCGVNNPTHRQCVPVATWKLNATTNTRVEYKEITDGVTEVLR